MNPLDLLESQIEQLSQREPASLVERRNLLLEIDEFLSSEDYMDLNQEQRGRLQAARKDLVSAIQQQESQEQAPELSAPDSQAQNASASTSADIRPNQEAVREHNPAAEQQMEGA